MTETTTASSGWHPPLVEEPDFPAEMSFVISLAGKPFHVSPVGDDDKPRDVQRIRIDCGGVAVFIRREDVPDLVAALLRAVGA
jgi:hypothetical protein